MKINLTGKTFGCLGLKGTGKSTLADKILTEYGAQALYYDTLHEAPLESPFDIYQPKDRYSVTELEDVIRAITPTNASTLPKYRLFVVDEMNRFAPSKPSPLPRVVADLNDQCRHYLMTFGFIARRPSQLNQDLTELSDYLFIFRLTGKNDIAYLNDTSNGLGDAVLSLKNFEFVIVNPDKSFSISSPIAPEKDWVSRAKHLIDR